MDQSIACSTTCISSFYSIDWLGLTQPTDIQAYRPTTSVTSCLSRFHWRSFMILQLNLLRMWLNVNSSHSYYINSIERIPITLALGKTWWSTRNSAPLLSRKWSIIDNNMSISIGRIHVKLRESTTTTLKMIQLPQQQLPRWLPIGLSNRGQ